MAERVGIVASCFDLFHAGHVLMLYEAKQHCDRLVVALQSDPTLDRPEKNKPIQGLFERFVQVESCEYVDQVVPYDTEADLYNLLAGYDWDVRFLGADYVGRTDFTGYDLHIPIHYCSRKHDYSSSGLRERILNAESNEGKFVPGLSRMAKSVEGVLK